MPKLWSSTIETHRREVREAILDATAGLVEANGLLSVTMSQIAEASGIGRATLYKYFPDLEAIIAAWHERQVARHLDHLAHVRDQADAGNRLPAVLEAYAFTSRGPHGRHDAELTAFLHSSRHMARAEEELRRTIRDLLAEDDSIRSDVPIDELVAYCLHALGAANGATSKSSVRRLVAVILSGLRGT